MTVNERSRSALASEVLSSASVRIASCCCPFSTSTLAAAESSAACAPWAGAAPAGAPPPLFGVRCPLLRFFLGENFLGGGCLRRRPPSPQGCWGKHPSPPR